MSKPQEQIEKDFKQLVLNMLPGDEKESISQISAPDLYHLVYGAYNPYSAVKNIVESLHPTLNTFYIYNIIIHLREIKDDLKKEIINEM